MGLNGRIIDPSQITPRHEFERGLNFEIHYSSARGLAHTGSSVTTFGSNRRAQEKSRMSTLTLSSSSRENTYFQKNRVYPSTKFSDTPGRMANKILRQNQGGKNPNRRENLESTGEISATPGRLYGVLPQGVKRRGRHLNGWKDYP